MKHGVLGRQGVFVHVLIRPGVSPDSAPLQDLHRAPAPRRV